MATPVGLISMAVLGIGGVVGISLIAACPRLSVQTAGTAAIYLGLASNQPFFSTAAYALIVAALGVGMVRVAKEVW